MRFYAVPSWRLVRQLAADHAPLLARMAASPLRVEPVPPESPLFRFVQ